MNSARALIVLCLMGLLVVALKATGSPQEKPVSEQADRDRAADEAALRAVVAEFVRAFNAGDARALASLFTTNARVTTLNGQAVEGRAAIEAQFATLFADHPGQTLEVKTESLRFLGAGAAIEEGTATITDPASTEEPAPAAEGSRYAVAYVKQDGKWLHDSIRDYPLADPAGEKTAHDHLAVLDWLVGEWIDESDEAEVHTSCHWTDDGSYLVRSFQVKIRGQAAMSGSQRIGWDPRLKQIRSWVFDTDGGFTEGLWSGGGDRWVIKASGFLKDGRSATATHGIERINRDTIKWTSADRTFGAEVLPDFEEITLVRKPPQPRSVPAETRAGQPERSQP